jgi:lipoate-protein ligase A
LGWSIEGSVIESGTWSGMLFNQQSAIGNQQLTMDWTLLLERAPRCGAENMALDQALLDQACTGGAGFLRLYRWAPFCLSFGRHEPATRRYDRDAIARLGLDTVRRPTGGRAVWHGRELTYAVAAPIAWFGSLAETYRSIHDTLAQAMRSLGVPATLAPATRTVALGSGACFASAAGGEVLAQGRKLIGSAQLRHHTVFLQHGSILLEDGQETVASVTRRSSDEGREARGEGPEGPGELPARGVEITLHEAAGYTVGSDQAATAVANAAQRWGGAWRTANDSDASALITRHVEQFRDPAWTWRR